MLTGKMERENMHECGGFLGELLVVRESVDFSRDILNTFGEEEHWPSRLSIGDLEAKYPDRNRAEIVYHLNCCIQAGLLSGKAEPIHFLSTTKTAFNVQIEGLTHNGNEFLSGADSSNFWRKAIDLCKSKGVEVTTNRVSWALDLLIQRALSG